MPARYYIEAANIDEAILKVHHGVDIMDLEYEFESAEAAAESDVLIRDRANPNPDPWIRTAQRAKDQGYYVKAGTTAEELAARYVALAPKSAESAVTRLTEARERLMVDPAMKYETLIEASRIAQDQLMDQL